MGCNLPSGSSRVAAIAALASVVFLMACFTYSTSVTLESVRTDSPALSAIEIAEATALVESVATQSGLEALAIYSEWERKAAGDAQSLYRPLASYRKPEKMLPSRSETREGSWAQVWVTVEERRDHRGLRVIIRDLTNDEATEFTSALEREIERVLGERFESYEVVVERGRVGPHFYAP